jgi:antitoxin (DNA-binding transcriptional repressor) of toxin-antitoxin stability system
MTQQIRSISVTKFKANCEAIIEYVNNEDKTVIITKYKKPIAKLTAYKDKRVTLFGALKGTVIIKGNIVNESLFTSESKFALHLVEFVEKK